MKSTCAALFCIALAGCAHGRLTPPDEGGPVWLRVTTTHLTLTTDLPAAEASQAVRELEAVRDSLARTASPNLRRFSRLHLVVFRSTGELRAFADQSFGGFSGGFRMVTANINGYRTEGLGGEPMIVTRAEAPLVENNGVTASLAESLDITYRAYLAALDKPGAPYDGPVRVDALPPAEVHGLWAGLFLAKGPNPSQERGKEHATRALQLDPENVSARLAGTWAWNDAERLAMLRLLRERAPGDPRPCQRLLREQTATEAEQLECSARLLDANTDTLVAHAFRTAVLLKQRRVDEAESAVRAFESVADVDYAVRANLAVLQAESGRCAPALASLEASKKQAAQASAKDPRLDKLGEQLARRCPPQR